VAKQKLRQRPKDTLIKHFKAMYPKLTIQEIRQKLFKQNPNVTASKVPVPKAVYDMMLQNMTKRTPLITSKRNAFVAHVKNVHSGINNSTVNTLVNAWRGSATPPKRRLKRKRTSVAMNTP